MIRLHIQQALSGIPVILIVRSRTNYFFTFIRLEAEMENGVLEADIFWASQESFHIFVGPSGSLPLSQKPASCQYRDPDESIIRGHIGFSRKLKGIISELRPRSGND